MFPHKNIKRINARLTFFFRFRVKRRIYWFYIVRRFFFVFCWENSFQDSKNNSHGVRMIENVTQVVGTLLFVEIERFPTVFEITTKIQKEKKKLKNLRLNFP